MEETVTHQEDLSLEKISIELFNKSKLAFKLKGLKTNLNQHLMKEPDRSVVLTRCGYKQLTENHFWLEKNTNNKDASGEGSLCLSDDNSEIHVYGECKENADLAGSIAKTLGWVNCALIANIESLDYAKKSAESYKTFVEETNIFELEKEKDELEKHASAHIEVEDETKPEINAEVEAHTATHVEDEAKPEIKAEVVVHAATHVEDEAKPEIAATHVEDEAKPETTKSEPKNKIQQTIQSIINPSIEAARLLEIDAIKNAELALIDVKLATEARKKTEVELGLEYDKDEESNAFELVVAELIEEALQKGNLQALDNFALLLEKRGYKFKFQISFETIDSGLSDED